MSASQVAALTALAEPVAIAHGCALEEIVIRRAGKRRLVRIVVDHDQGELTLDLVASMSRDISRKLDDSSPLGQSPYVLEVTSPGVDRPLTQTRHWDKATGRLVRLVTTQGETLSGRLTHVDETSAVLMIDDSETAVAREDIARATVQVEFNRPGGADAADEDSSEPAESEDPAQVAPAEEG